MVYLLLFLWLIFCAQIFRVNELETRFVSKGLATPFFHFNEFKKRRKYFLLAFFFVACLVMGMRDVSVGTDTKEYRQIFSYVTEKNWSQVFATYGIFTQFEIGYAVLMKLCSLLHGSYFYFQFVSSILYCLGIAIFIYDDTDDILMRLIVYMGIGTFLRAFNIARQAFAVMLLMNSWKSLKNNRFATSILLYVLSITIHSTSIVFGVVFIIEWLKKYDKFLSVFPFVFFGVVICCKPLLVLIISKFPKYAEYLQVYQTVRPGMSIMLLMVVIIFSLAVLYHKSEYKTTEKTIAVYSLIYVGVTALGYGIPLFERMGYYFTPFVCLLFPLGKRIVKEFNLEYLYSNGVNLCFFLFYVLTVFDKEIYLTFV